MMDYMDTNQVMVNQLNRKIHKVKLEKHMSFQIEISSNDGLYGYKLGDGMDTNQVTVWGYKLGDSLAWSKYLQSEVRQ